LVKGGPTPRARPFSSMAPSHWLISGFIVFQLLAIVVGSTPDPTSLPGPVPPERTAITPLGRTLAPILDAGVAPLLAFHARFFRAMWWCRPPVRAYLGTTQQYQRWNMFSRPLRSHEYIHLRYYVASEGSGLLRVHRELVYPGHAVGRIRLLKSYADSFRDKAMTLALDGYGRKFRRERARHDLGAALELAQNELFSIIRPFASRRQAGLALGPGERLIRAELWHGVAPMPRPGQVLPQEVLAAREETLESYDAVTDLGLTPITDLPPLGAVTYDADIKWNLLAQVTWK
jgi:hypothetical protein